LYVRVCKVMFVEPKKQSQGVCFIKKEGFHFFMSESLQFLQGGFVKILDYSGENVYMVYIERVCSIFYCWKVWSLLKCQNL
jgi:hypothetical protein